MAEEPFYEFSAVCDTKTRFRNGEAYSGGEVLMKMTRDPPANVLARVHNSNELMRLLHYLHGAPTGSVQTVCIPYLPYARQDRPTDKGTHNAVEVLGSLLATTGVSNFLTFDVHSSASVTAFAKAGLTLESRPSNVLIDGYLAELESRGIIDRSKVALVVPDKGGKAREKEQQAALASGRAIEVPIVHCDKVRDLSGRITNISLETDTSPAELAPGTAIFIVDDICDGGATFEGAARVLKENYPNVASECTMHLWVTHGIFSRGLDSLLTTGDGSFNTIGCSDSFTPFCNPCEQLVIVPVSRAIEVASIL